MVEKKEGAEMTCRSCGTDLICRMKEYKGDFAPKLQWQNEDYSAHYNTKDGKTFTCNIPNDDEAQEAPVTDTVSSSNVDLKPLDAGTKKLVSNEAEFICHIRKEVIATVKKHDVDPHPGMIWEMSALIWKKYFGASEE